MANQEHFPTRIRIRTAPRHDGKILPAVRQRIAESLSNSVRDTLLTVAQPATNPRFKVYGTEQHIVADLIVDKPDDASDANEWRLRFNANNFKSQVRKAIETCINDIDAEKYENLIQVG